VIQLYSFLASWPVLEFLNNLWGLEPIRKRVVSRNTVPYCSIPVDINTGTQSKHDEHVISMVLS